MSDTIETIKAEIAALEAEHANLIAREKRLTAELQQVSERLSKLQPSWSGAYGLISAARNRLASEEARVKRERIWTTAPVIKIEGRPDGRLIKLTARQIHVMTTPDGGKIIYDRATGKTRWKIDGRITNLDELEGKP